MIRFVVRAIGTYIVGATIVEGTACIAKQVIRRINKRKPNANECYTHCVGFEVEPGEVYEDDSDKGEFVVKGFVGK